MSKLRIRRAGLDDTKVIAAIHTRGWQWGYRGLLPDEFLARLSLEEREETWRIQLAPDHPAHTWIAEDGQEPVGFVTCGPERTTDTDGSTGEVYAIYEEEHVAGTGVGRQLLSRATADLRSLGFTRATLWVLETNARARRFYELAGWRAAGSTKVELRGGTLQLREVRYDIEWK